MRDWFDWLERRRWPLCERKGGDCWQCARLVEQHRLDGHVATGTDLRRHRTGEPRRGYNQQVERQRN
jgi:hypothetical protein